MTSSDVAELKFSRASEIEVCKVDPELGLVFGFAIICKVDGVNYFDTQGDHIPERAMLKASMAFMKSERTSTDMHEGDDGQVVFAFPLTAEVAKALEIETEKTGLLIAMQPSPEVFAKFKDGTYTGFSIGGSYGETKVVA